LGQNILSDFSRFFPQFDRKCLQENHVKNIEKPKTVLEWETAGFSGIQIPDHSISHPY